MVASGGTASGNFWISMNKNKLPTDSELRLPSFALQTLSAELSALSSELASQGPKVTGALGSEGAQQCVEGVSRVVSVVQAALVKSEEELRSLQRDSVEKQVRAAGGRSSLSFQ